MKKHFITGLIILLPLAVTLAVAIFIFNLITEPLAGFLVKILNHFQVFENTAPQMQFFLSQILILVLLFFFTVALGMIARYFFINYLISLWDYVIHKIPLVRSVYKATQDVIKTLFTSQSSAFKQVVLAPFPYENAYSVGFITQEKVTGSLATEANVAVFIPTTPNPTSGFLMLYPKKDLIYLDMKVEDAFKYVISCGVIPMTFTSILPPEMIGEIP